MTRVIPDLRLQFLPIVGILIAIAGTTTMDATGLLN